MASPLTSLFPFLAGSLVPSLFESRSILANHARRPMESDTFDAAPKRPRSASPPLEDEVSNSAKRRRKSCREGRDGEDEEVRMRRVAEIVLVLSAMGRMRGGREPTSVEKAMMSEARNNVVRLCEELAPKDILPLEAFKSVIEDLGLNRFKEEERRLGFRGPPKMTINDIIAFSKRKMEDSKTFAAQPVSYPSQRLQTGAAGENHGKPVNVFSSDKTGHVPVSAGSYQPPTPVVQVSSGTSTPLPSRPPGTEVRPPLISGPVPSSTGRDSPLMVPPRVDRAHIRPDARPNGPSFAPHVPVTSSASQHLRTTPVPLQPQPSPWANVAAKNKVPDHHPVRVDGNATVSTPSKMAPPVVGPTAKPVVSQTAPVTPPNIHQPVQGVPFAHTSHILKHHLEISKSVQELLNPKLPERPVWILPSRDYMTKTVSCQFCKVVIHDVESVLVCDACEKGYHLGCLQSHNTKGIPRGEWHCPRCLAMNRGKPFPPKYGRVTRNSNAPKAAGCTSLVQFSSEKKVESIASEKKVESTDQKVSKPSAMTNGNPDFKTHPQGSEVAESFDSKLSKDNKINNNDMPTDFKKDDKPNSEKHQIAAIGATVDALPATLSTKSGESCLPQQVKSEVSPSEGRLASENKSLIPTVPQQINTSDQSSTSSHQNDVDGERLSNGVQVRVHQHGNCNGTVELDKYNDDDERRGKDVAQENLLAGENFHDQTREHAESSENGQANVVWIGDVDRVSDEKKFFQSCCINGVVYKVQDYALIPSDDSKLIPVKLQAMWQDTQTNSKWLVIHKCYFPDDLPEAVGRPGAPQCNEVYESTRDSNVMAGFIQGPCEVLPFRKFGEEMEGSNLDSQGNDRKRPVFIRNWFYDESKRAFCPSAS